MSETADAPSQVLLHQGIKRIGSMIQERRLTKEFFKSEEFVAAFKELQACMYSQRASNVWTALSVAGRASSISKPAEAVFSPTIMRRLSETLPLWHELEDGEDRYYLAKALQTAPNRQIVDYAFAELAGEKAAEKARRVWAQLALTHSPSLEEFLVQLNQSISLVRQKQGLTVDSLIRRIRRINNTISEDLATAEKTAGSEFGTALRDFYAGPAMANGPDDLELRKESAGEFIQCIAKITRLNFRAASDPSVYGVLTALRRWWHPSSPPARFEITSKKVALVGIETLHIFARQGVQNKPLRDAIAHACGRSVVDHLSKSLADTDVSLPEHISYWFAHGADQTSQRSTHGIETISGKLLDERVGRLLIAVSSPDSSYRTLKIVADQVSVLMPEEANTLARAASRLSQITQWSRAVARARNIELLAERGDIVSFDPAIHDTTEDFIVGSKVVVTAPGVVTILPGRPQVLIMKAEVTGL